MRQRVQRLVDAGVMQIVAVTDPLTVGFPRAAMIGIRVEGDMRGWSPTSSRPMPEVDYVVITRRAASTSWSRWSCEDDDHLLDVINKQDPGHPRGRAHRDASST